MDEYKPTVVVLAGINGAGKTTASRALLADTFKISTFVNADIIAQGLCGFDPESAALQAGRVMLQRLDELAKLRHDFAFETTLAARSYANWLRALKEDGYEVHLLFYWLSSPEVAISRVATRVRLGGHHIPEATIRQRYPRTVRNFFSLYRPITATWRVYDNSMFGNSRLIAHGVGEQSETVVDAETWELIKRSGENG